MADRFLERVSETAGRAVRYLKEHQTQLYAWGMTAEAAALDPLIREQEDIVFDCMEDTAVDGMPVHPRTPPGGSKPSDR